MGTTEQTEETAGELEEHSDAGFIEDTPEEQEAILNESVEQTIERARKAQKEEGDESLHGEGEEVRSEGEGLSQAKPNTAKDQKSALEPIEPPQRLNAEQREQFKGAPREAQEMVIKTIRDLEDGQRNALRQIHDVKSEAEGIVTPIAPFVKDWATRGISAGQGIALLAQTHERMLENPAQEIARLITDNGLDIDDIENALDGGGGNRNGQTTQTTDISSHPEFQSLQKQNEYIINRIKSEEIQSETDKIKALADYEDEQGGKPFQHILNPAFLKYASPDRVSDRRTPPRGDDGRFTGAPKSLVDAYKELYQEWFSEINAAFPSNQSTSTPLETQPRKTLAEPVSMRPRNSRMNGRPVSRQEDNSQFLNESVEDTMRRVMAQNRG